MRVSLCTRHGVMAHRLPCLFYRWSRSLVRLRVPQKVVGVSRAFLGRGGTVQRMSFRIYAEAIVAELVPTKSWRLCGSLVLPGIFPCRWIFNFQDSEGSVAFRMRYPPHCPPEKTGECTPEFANIHRKFTNCIRFLGSSNKSLYSIAEKSGGCTNPGCQIAQIYFLTPSYPGGIAGITPSPSNRKNRQVDNRICKCSQTHIQFRNRPLYSIPEKT